MHNLEPSSTSPSQSDDHVFKVPYPVTRGDQNTSLTNNANSYPVKEEVEFVSMNKKCTFKGPYLWIIYRLSNCT